MYGEYKRDWNDEDSDNDDLDYHGRVDISLRSRQKLPPPPPPLPPISAPAVGAFGILRGKKNQPKLKNLYWDKLKPKHVKNTVWEAIEFDYNLDDEEMLELFQIKKKEKKSIRQKMKEAMKKDSKARNVDSSAKNVVLLDVQRHQNMSMGLKKLNRELPIDELPNAIRVMDEDLVGGVEGVEIILKLLPSREEMDLVTEYKGDEASLSGPERFILSIKDIPDLHQRVDLWLFKIHFEETLHELNDQITSVLACVSSIERSGRFLELLGIILAVGNHLNDSSKQYGNACGFRLESLRLLSITKTVDGSMTLLDYIAQYVYRVDPDIARFVEDFANIDTVVRIPQKDIEFTVNTMTEKVREIKKLLKKKKKRSKRDADFRAVMSDFLDAAELHVRTLGTMIEQARIQTLELATVFACEGKPSKFVWDDMFRMLDDFTVEYEASRRRVAQNQVELQSRKRKAMVSYWSQSVSQQYDMPQIMLTDE